MNEENFESKQHVTKHLTLGRFGMTEEATRVNSWPEQDYLSWKLFLARTLTPENVTPESLKTICLASDKYRKAYKSYKFGIIQGVKSSWLLIAVGAVVGLVLLLYFTGYIQVR
jgi:hypothetical protein